MTILPEQQSSGSNALYIRKKSAAKTKDKEPVRPHVKASLEDINWVRSQPPCVQQLWLDCVAVEQFGGQLRKLDTHLSSKSFRIAKTALEKRELFRFEAITQVSPSGRSNIMGWKIENLHGYYNKSYWEMVPSERENLPSGGEVLPASGENLPTTREKIPASGENLPSGRENLPDVELETRSMTEPVENQPLFNEPLTTPQPPTKVVEEGSSIPQETQGTPLRGVPATSGGMPEEEKEVGTIPPASVPDMPETTREESAASGGDESSGGDIATQPNSDKIDVVDADDDIVVGHADIVEVICQRVGKYYYQPTDEEKGQMMQLTISQLQVLSERFHHQIRQRTTIPSREKVKSIFTFSLGVGRYSAPV